MPDLPINTTDNTPSPGTHAQLHNDVNAKVNAHEASITANAQAIANNTAAISANSTNITANAAAIASLNGATEKVASKGVANGYAGLDGTGKVPTSQLPTTTIAAVTGLQVALDAKQPSGNYLTGLNGDVIAAGPGSAAATLAVITTAKTVGSAYKIPVIDIDPKGRITGASEITLVGGGGAALDIFDHTGTQINTVPVSKLSINDDLTGVAITLTETTPGEVVAAFDIDRAAMGFTADYVNLYTSYRSAVNVQDYIDTINPLIDKRHIEIKTAGFTIDYDGQDHIYLCDGTFNVQMTNFGNPIPVTYTVKNIGTGNITITQFTSGHLINGVNASYGPLAPGEWVTFFHEDNSGSGNWTVLKASSAGGVWGTITGTLSSQTDLAAALAAKATPSDITAAINNLVNSAPGTLDTLNELASALGNDPNYAATITAALAAKAPLASPTFTGTVSGITKAMVGLGSVDNTADSAKPVSTAQAAAIALKENAITAGTTSQYYRGDKTFQTLDKTAVGLSNVDNTSDATKNAASATLTNKTLTAPVINSPTGLVKADVGLGNVDNTSDANKPVSTAQATAIALKAADTAVVHNTGAETVAGVKTFSSSPVAPTPAALDNSTKVATTAYVDNLGVASTKKNMPVTGAINGSNVNYTVADTYVVGTLEVYLNGQRLYPGSGNDYVEVSAGFTMQYAPATGDVLSADYLTSSVTNTRASDTLVTGGSYTGAINGSNTTFTLPSAYTPGSLRIFIDGVRQKLTTDYTETPNSGTFTFVTAPLTGTILVVDYMISSGFVSPGSNSMVSDGTVTGSVNGSNTSFTVANGAYVGNSLEVYINGLHQIRGTDYTETTPTSGIFTMTIAPLTGDIIRVNYQFTVATAGNSDTVDGFHASRTAAANTILPLDVNGKQSSAVLTNPYKFRVYRNAALNTVTGNVATKVPFDTKTYDTSSNVDIVTNIGRFTAPIAGFYFFTSTVQTISTANLRADLYKNGAVASGGLNNGGSGVNQGSTVSDTIQLAAGDYVEVYVTAATAVAYFAGASGVYFSGFLVSAT